MRPIFTAKPARRRAERQRDEPFSGSVSISQLVDVRQFPTQISTAPAFTHASLKLSVSAASMQYNFSWFCFCLWNVSLKKISKIYTKDEIVFVFSTCQKGEKKGYWCFVFVCIWVWFPTRIFSFICICMFLFVLCMFSQVKPTVLWYAVFALNLTNIKIRKKTVWLYILLNPIARKQNEKLF